LLDEPFHQLVAAAAVDRRAFLVTGDSNGKKVPRPAATVMLVREEARGLAVYMARRSSQSSFVPDAYVFPGGGVDAADRAPELLARLIVPAAPPGPEFAIAALRELFEEAGILIASDAAGRRSVFDAARLAALRAERTAGVPFAALLEREELYLDTRDLIHYSNWITPQSEPLRFDVHFYLAAAPLDQVASVDAIEVHDGGWFAPDEALERAERGELTIIFPTRKHLERLAGFATLDALLAHARARAVAPIMPYQRDDGEFDFPPGDDRW
jgi:recombination protein RecT